MADFLGGAGGLFSGLSQGLQLILALRQAEENQRIARERNELMKKQDAREQATHETAQEVAPIEDIQEQLNRQNITAARPDIRREFTPPNIADTFQPTNKFAPPAFGSQRPQPNTAGTLDPSIHFPGKSYQERTTDVGRPAPSVGSLNTSHLAQVLERASRLGMHQRKMGTLTDILTSASKQAQQTQLPVSGAFGPEETVDGQQVRAELPSGFTAQPERTFSPVQMGTGGNREADRLARLITMVRARIPTDALKLLDLGTKPGEVAKLFQGAQEDLRYLVELTGLYARAIGAPSGGRQLDADPDDPQPGETAQAYADRVGPKLGGEEAEARWLRSIGNAPR